MAISILCREFFLISSAYSANLLGQCRIVYRPLKLRHLILEEFFLFHVFVELFRANHILFLMK
jgi:hypothetical protein